jgi:hypothetical protein
MKTTQNMSSRTLVCAAVLTMTFGATGMSEAYASSRSPSTDSSPVTLEVVETDAVQPDAFPFLIAGAAFAYKVGLDVGQALHKYLNGKVDPKGDFIDMPELPSKAKVPFYAEDILVVKQVKGTTASSLSTKSQLNGVSPEFLLDF